MKSWSRGACLLGLLALPAGCVIVTGSGGRQPVSGPISGQVVNASGRPLAGIKVYGIYYRGFATVPPPITGVYVVAVARTDTAGRFTLATRKKVHELNAGTLGLDAAGYLQPVRRTGNVIVVGESSPGPKPRLRVGREDRD